VHHGQRLQQGGEGGDEAHEALARLGVDRVDGTDGDLQVEQLPHRLDDPAVGDVLAGEQVGDDRSCPRAVADRCPGFAGERLCRLAPAFAPVGVRAVLGDDGDDGRDVDGLAPRVAAVGRLAGKGRAAADAPFRAVVDDVVRCVRHLEGLAFGALLLPPAALGAAGSLRLLLPLLGLALALGCRITRRGLAGVARVLAAGALELGNAGGELLVISPQLPELSPQLLDHLGLTDDEIGQLLVGRSALVVHIDSPANSRPNREHRRLTNALVARVFQNFPMVCDSGR